MNKKKAVITFFIFQCLIACLSAQKTVEYDLFVRDTLVNFTGKAKKALSINNQMPAPTLYFTEGDTALIRVHNQTENQETTLHWHGLMVPVEQDGVPYLTTAPTFSGETHTYKFPIVQNGTYFYHSHSGLQQQIGLYGAFIINKRDNDPTLREEDSLPNHVIVLSDWTDTNPMEVMRRLKTNSDWSEIKKESTQSYVEAIRKGHLKTKLTNEWKRMSAMDVSDVYYDRFLINGRRYVDFSKYRAGDRVRLRLINASSSTYFWAQYAGGKITVIASDGKDVDPVEVDRMIMGVSETYDVVVTVPKDMKYEMLFTSEDRSGSTSLWLGQGMGMSVEPLPQLDYFAGMQMMNNMMGMNGQMKKSSMSMSMQTMDMNEVMYPEIQKSKMNMQAHHKMNMEGMESDASNTKKEKEKKKKQGKAKSIINYGMSDMNYEVMNHKPADGKSLELVTLNYSMLKSPTKTILPVEAPVKELKFELTGNMDRYVWTLDNKTVSESDKILIKKGENVRLILTNNSMMRHPMHLHGHFFRVINGQEEYAPLKTVLDIMPMETDTIEFNASEKSGDWYFHCHILYHMMTGMGRIFSYEDSEPNKQIEDPHHALKMVYMDDRMYYLTAQNDFASNGNYGKMEYSNTRWSLQSEWGLGYEKRHGFDTEVRGGRYLGSRQWLLPYVGASWNYHKGDEKNIFGQKQINHRLSAIAGFQYTLPMLFVLDARIDMYGKVRLQLVREDITVTNRLRMDLNVNTDKEYRVGLRYVLSPYLGIGANYDSEMKWGAGITLNY